MTDRDHGLTIEIEFDDQASPLLDQYAEALRGAIIEVVDAHAMPPELLEAKEPGGLNPDQQLRAMLGSHLGWCQRRSTPRRSQK